MSPDLMHGVGAFGYGRSHPLTREPAMTLRGRRRRRGDERAGFQERRRIDAEGWPAVLLTRRPPC
jgi:hypothetical protein